MIYLDNSATTKIAPEVLDAMLPYLKEEYGNPSSKYYTLADNAKKAVEHARQQVADFIGCQADEIIFTSGATESNNMILKGVSEYYMTKGTHIVTTKTEHPSVLETCNYLVSKGSRVTFLDVDPYGRVNLNDVISLLTSDDKPILVSIIWGNNEIGSLNDIEAIAKLCHKHNVFFHTDATQVLGKVKFNLTNLPGVQFLSCSAHKLHGPKGIGACVIRKHKLGFKTKITPLLHGGGQENDYRSGTLAVHNIVGFGKAAEISACSINNNIKILRGLEVTTKELLVKKFGDIVHFNSIDSPADKIPGIISLQLKGINNELFVKKFSNIIAVSTGSACSSTKPSHVLIATGKLTHEIQNTLRISLSPFINSKDISTIINDLVLF